MVRIDCLLTFIYCFLHRCEALRQRVLYVSQLHVHNNVITLKYQTEPATFKVMYANSSFRRTEKRKPKRLVIFGELRKDNRANDLLKAQEGSKDKGWQNSWSNYSQAVFFFISGRTHLWTCNHSQPFGEKLWDDGRQMRPPDQQNGPG